MNSKELSRQYEHKSKDLLTRDNLKGALDIVCAKLNQELSPIQVERFVDVEDKGDWGYGLLIKGPGGEIPLLVSIVKLETLIEEKLIERNQDDDPNQELLCLWQPIFVSASSKLDFQKWKRVSKKYKEWVDNEADVYAFYSNINPDNNEVNITIWEWEYLTNATIDYLKQYIVDHLQAIGGEEGMLAKFREIVNKENAKTR